MPARIDAALRPARPAPALPARPTPSPARPPRPSPDTFVGPVRVAAPASRSLVSAPVFFKMDASLVTGLARFTFPAGTLTAAEVRSLSGTGHCPKPFSTDERVKVTVSKGALNVDVPKAQLEAWRQANVPLHFDTKAGPPLQLTLKPQALRADTTAAEVALKKEDLARYQGYVADAKVKLEEALKLQANPPAIEGAGELAALEDKLRAAQTLVAFHLGALRATVLTAKAPSLAVAATMMGGDIERAGRALVKANNEAIELGKRIADLEQKLAAAPGSATLARELAESTARRDTAERDVRTGVAEVQRLLLSADPAKLAEVEPVLRRSPAHDTLSAMTEAKRLEKELTWQRDLVERAKAEQPRKLAGGVQVARDQLAHWEKLVTETRAQLKRLAGNPLVTDVPRVVR